MRTALDPDPDGVRHGEVRRLVAEGAVRTIFQPIVDLATGAVVAHEALSRGPAGPLQDPTALFAAARKAGVLAELDRVCLVSALRTGAALFELGATLFVNVEPEALDFSSIDDLAEVTGATSRLHVVLEITERALAARPAELLLAVEKVHALGWGVALDDVGAESASLAFMPLLRPDVIKLDLDLVQRTPTWATAEVMHAVNAHAERSGALVLAEGIETAAHATASRAMGATLGQGWLYGRPATSPATTSGGPLALTDPDGPTATGPLDSPFDLLPAGSRLMRSPKGLLVELSKHLEREAARIGDTCVVTATFQHARYFTPDTAARYRRLAERTSFVCAVGEGLPDEPVPGVRGGDLVPGDPLRHEWDVTVLSPHFATALVARDLGDGGPERDRMYEYVLTYDRRTVTEVTRCIMSRITGLDLPT